MLSRLALAAALVLPATLAAETAPRLPDAAIPVAERLRDQALRGTEAFQIVEDLTTEVGPRLPGSEADARAVAWAVERFGQLGFDRVWTEPVTLPYWYRGHERAAVVGANAQPLLITALGGSVGTGGQPLEAEVVAFDNLAALREAPAGSLEGKIAFINNRMERFRDGRGYGPAVSARSDGAVEAARAGAVAIVIRSISTGVHRFPHTGTMRYVEGVPRIPAAALSNPDADQLTRLMARGAVRIQLDIDAGVRGEATTYNVIGEITGRSQPERIVVIGGHLDSWDLGTGALDDGAGVAITMAAGAAIARLPKEQRPAATVRVIAWGAEEIGLLGARVYAANVAGQIGNHLIGAESDFGAGRIYALRAGVKESAWPVIERIGAVLAPLGIETEAGRGGPGPDIIPLAQRGMAWAQLAQDGTDYFDYHHTPDDTLDKIDPEALDQQVAAYAAFAYLAASIEGDFGSQPREVSGDEPSR